MYLLEDEGIPETKGKGMVNETASKDTKDKMLQGLSLYLYCMVKRPIFILYTHNGLQKVMHQTGSRG